MTPISINIKSLAPFSIMLTISVMVSLTVSSMPVLAPIAAGKIGVSPAHLGYFISLIYISSMVATLMSGSFITRFGAVRWSQVSLGLCALGLLSTASASIPCLLLGAIAIGLGYGPITPASSHVLAKTTPKNLIAITFSVRQTGVPLGGMIAGALVPSLALRFGWQINALILAGMCLVFAALAQSLRAQLDSDRQYCRLFSFRQLTEPLKLVFSDPRLLELAWVSFLFCSLQMVLTTYLVTYLTVDFHIPLITAGLILAATQFASIGARILWGVIADRFFSPRLVLGFLGVAMAAAAILTGLSSQAWPINCIIAVNVMFGATAIGWNGVFLAEVARIAPPGLAAVATGGSLFFTYLGGMIGPAIFALIVSLTDNYQYGFLAFGVIALIAGARILLTSRKG